MTTTIRDNADQSRFEIYLDDTLAGYADYDDQDGQRVFPHTVTLPQFRGQGLAGRLVEHALDEARDQERRVVPACSFVADYVAAHPEYAGLVR